MFIKELKNTGFTLIELLIVIGIMAILISATIRAINPGRQFAQARDAQRWGHVLAILNAVDQNIANNYGQWTCSAGLLPSIPTIMRADDGIPTTSEYDICSCLVDTYLAEMPYDPDRFKGFYTNCASYDSGYTIKATATERVTVSATGELAVISVTR